MRSTHLNAEKPLVVGIGGTTRSQSSSEMALAVSLEAARTAGAETLMFSGSALELPLYAPSSKAREPAAERLIEALRRADGVIISSPSYHGGVSGMIKNALDYVEDMRGDDRIYFDGRAVGCIACGAGWNATGQTLASLRAVVHALRGWPTPMGVVMNTNPASDGGMPAWQHPETVAQLQIVGRQVVEFALAKRCSLNPPLPLGQADRIMAAS
jgi:FMN reductase